MKTIDQWSELTMGHLLYAYRKAKADVYFDRVPGSALKFAEYEAELPARLAILLKRLRESKTAAILRANRCTPRLVAKKLGIETMRRPAGRNFHQNFSSSDRFFDDLVKHNKLRAQFRFVSDFGVEFHIVSALWINLVGHRFDAILSKDSYGTRLKRRPAEPCQDSDEPGQYNLDEVGSFEQYYAPYRKWQSGSLATIKNELEKDSEVIAISLDIANFYHSIDPTFILSDEYSRVSGVKMTSFEKEFTRTLVHSMKSWSKLTADKLEAPGVDADIGLPMGLAASRILANALLFGLDKSIKEGLAPIYFGRYVDDVLIVIRDPGNITGAAELFEYMENRIDVLTSDPGPGPSETASMDDESNAVVEADNDGVSDDLEYRIKLSYGKKSLLKLKSAKQKVFFLDGRSGLDLLAAIQAELRAVSSEWRLLPMPDGLDSTASANVLTAADMASDQATSIGKANGLTIRRLGWSVQLRQVETLGRALLPNEWEAGRHSFYDFTCEHVLRPDRLLDYLDHLPRLVALAVQMGDWKSLYTMYCRVKRSVNRLETAAKVHTFSVEVNGIEVPTPDSHWNELMQSINSLVSESILRSLVPLKQNRIPDKLRKLLIADPTSVERLSTRLHESDLAFTPYKEYLRTAAQEMPSVKDELSVYKHYHHIDKLKKFLDSTKQLQVGDASRVSASIRADQSTESLIPYVFPTRPYEVREISLYLPSECLFATTDITAKDAWHTWAAYTQAIRGHSLPRQIEQNTEHKNKDEDTDDAEKRYVFIGTQKPKQKIFLGVSSLKTIYDAHNESKSGLPATSRERYERINRIVNSAMNARPRPTHLLLPELSLPEAWLGLITDRLLSSGISLIAGLDYQHYPNTTATRSKVAALSPCTEIVGGANQIHPSDTAGGISSSAVLVLHDGRLGSKSAIEIRQAKQLPAPSEEQDLLARAGKIWNTSEPIEPLCGQKPVYIHKGFAFGVLVCSELQNMRHRLSFQGIIDALFVLSWNKDLPTFNALVASATLDLHAYVALVNNRKYGGSQVRAPAKKSHAQEIGHVHGGENDQVIVVEINYSLLRSFQSRHKRWPNGDDPFKPVPEGFKISKYRRKA